ncbi:MAG: hypothetical protein ABI286_00285 [Edaphobacter sp.]
MKTEITELRMPADEFDRIMRQALQTAPPPAKKPKASPVKKATRRTK